MKTVIGLTYKAFRRDKRGPEPPGTPSGRGRCIYHGADGRCVFGYTLPVYSRMSSQDLADYRRYYCETCHQLKAGYGLTSTSAVNYDMAFNLIILSSVSGYTEFDPTPASPRCVFRKPGADSDIFRAMAGYTVLLTKWELYDDMVDKPSMKTRFIDLMLSKAISRAEEEYPEADRIVGEGFGKLRELEEQKCKDPVQLGRTFGEALSEPMERMVDPELSGILRELFTSLTCIVYVMDALDDLEDDYMDGTFNPFLVDRDDFVNRKQFMDAKMYEIARLVKQCVQDLQDAYAEVRPHMKGLTGAADNIVYFGIPESAKNAIAGRGEAKMSVKNALSRRKERTATY